MAASRKEATMSVGNSMVERLRGVRVLHQPKSSEFPGIRKENGHTEGAHNSRGSDCFSLTCSNSRLTAATAKNPTLPTSFNRTFRLKKNRFDKFCESERCIWKTVSPWNGFNSDDHRFSIYVLRFVIERCGFSSVSPTWTFSNFRRLIWMLVSKFLIRTALGTSEGDRKIKMEVLFFLFTKSHGVVPCARVFSTAFQRKVSSWA